MWRCKMRRRKMWRCKVCRRKMRRCIISAPFSNRTLHNPKPRRSRKNIWRRQRSSCDIRPSCVSQSLFQRVTCVFSSILPKFHNRGRGTAWLVTMAVQRRGCYKSLIWIPDAESTYQYLFWHVYFLFFQFCIMARWPSHKTTRVAHGKTKPSWEFSHSSTELSIKPSTTCGLRSFKCVFIRVYIYILLDMRIIAYLESLDIVYTWYYMRVRILYYTYRYRYARALHFNSYAYIIYIYTPVCVCPSSFRHSWPLSAPPVVVSTSWVASPACGAKLAAHWTPYADIRGPSEKTWNWKPLKKI